MIVEALPLSGCFKIVPEPIQDERGFFARSYSREIFACSGLETEFPEWSISYNRRRGTLRGLHMQAAPKPEVKLVQCIGGAVFDVVVDMRPESRTFGQYVAVELNSESRTILYIPAGFAHGYQTLTDDAELHYHISCTFDASLATGVRWNDPDLRIPWPEMSDRILSARDQALPFVSEVYCSR